MPKVTSKPNEVKVTKNIGGSVTNKLTNVFSERSR